MPTYDGLEGLSVTKAAHDLQQNIAETTAKRAAIVDGLVADIDSHGLEQDTAEQISAEMDDYSEF